VRLCTLISGVTGSRPRRETRTRTTPGANRRLTRTERYAGDGEDWAGWWNAIRDDPELSQAVAERDRLRFEHPEKTETNLAVHERALRDAGFDEVGVLWRKGTNAVLVALL
jgi:hypothetical protein